MSDAGYTESKPPAPQSPLRSSGKRKLSDASTEKPDATTSENKPKKARTEPDSSNGWTFEKGPSLGKVASVEQHLGVLKKGGSTIFFGPKKLAAKLRDNTLYYDDKGVNCFRVDMTIQSHGQDDVEGKSVGCFIAAADAIKAQLEETLNKTVLIHCDNGRSRTAHALIVFLMRHHSLSADAAAAFITAAQKERGLQTFSTAPATTAGRETYFDWIKKAEKGGTINDEGTDYLAMYSFSKPLVDETKWVCLVGENRSKLEKEFVKQQKLETKAEKKRADKGPPEQEKAANGPSENDSVT
jgi:hypothetical protein